MESLNEKNENPGWTILTLGFPKYNSLIKINKSTAKIIKLINKLGFDKLIGLKKEILEGSDEEILTKKWFDWLGNEKLFSYLYEQFLLINCSYLPSSLHGYKFCEFVETQLRIELMENIEKVDEIEYCHVKPLKLLNYKECPKEMGKKLKLDMYKLVNWN
uniref:Uncharacterized protein n=1 Tax=Meloidogyne enterolobii TaxID=390850 RepID=A0A6V7WIL9_MELEN|nr:unnamed protein product [Meloidogyne enterolobii]